MTARRERPSAGITVLDGLYVLLAASLAVASAWPIYQHPRVLLVGAVGIGVGLLCALGGRALRLPFWIDLLAAVACYLLVAVPVAIPSAMPGRWIAGLRDATLGVVTGWKDLVTVELPLGAYQAVLVPFLVVMLFGSYAAARIATSARRGRILAPVVLLAMFGFGLAFGTSALGEPYAPGRIPPLPVVGVVTVAMVLVAAALLLVVLSLVWLSLRARRTRAEALARATGVAQSGVTVRRTSGWALVRRGGLAAMMVAVAVVGAGLIAIPASGAPRDVIRDHVRPFELVSPQPSPLSAYREWVADGRYDAELFAVEAPERVDRLRLAVMDAYDGTRFTVSDLADGSRFARIDGTTASGGATVTVTVGPGYGEPWVPLPGDRTAPATFPAGGDRAAELEDALYYSTDDSLAIVVAPRPDGGAGLGQGDRVTASGLVVGDVRERIAAAPGGAPIGGVTAEAYPNLIGWIDDQRAGAGGAAVLELIDRLRARGYLSHGLLQDEAEAAEWYRDLAARAPGYTFKESRAGHSAQRIEALFEQLTARARQAEATGAVDEAAYVAGIGDDEQFAAAAALIAWANGIPARVVLGVRLHDDPAAPVEPGVEACAAAGDGVYECAGRSVAAWVEVQVAGEWLPIDTGPQFTTPPADTDQGATPPAHGTVPERPASSVVDPPEAARPQVESRAAEEDAAGPVLSSAALLALRVAAVAAAGLGLLLVPPGILVGAKAVRRSRRRSTDPETAIVGAWEELVDESVDLRLLPRAAGGTRVQLAARLDDPVARQLAAAADRAVFGATAPAESDSALAWRLLDERRTRLRQDVPIRARLRAMLNPASFIRHLRPTSARITLEPDPRGEVE
ncbi:MAG: hypothetical protein BGO95_09810 [Micrococcales bacterium 73-13]|nr:MAG: hypothetical protein BGO95_09810 [Micrococcales bacterium 73-13]